MRPSPFTQFMCKEIYPNFTPDVKKLQLSGMLKLHSHHSLQKSPHDKTGITSMIIEVKVLYSWATN